MVYLQCVPADTLHGQVGSSTKDLHGAAEQLSREERHTNNV